MITRNRKINTNASEIQLHICFSKVDVLAWVRRYTFFIDNMGEEVRDELLNEPIVERQMRSFFENDERCLSNFANKWKEQISAWAWNVCIREGYVVQSSTPSCENEYYLAPISLVRRGRPKTRQL